MKTSQVNLRFFNSNTNAKKKKKKQLSYIVKFLYKKENIIFKPLKEKNFDHRIIQFGSIMKLSSMQSHRLPLSAHSENTHQGSTPIKR